MSRKGLEASGGWLFTSVYLLVMKDFKVKSLRISFTLLIHNPLKHFCKCLGIVTMQGYLVKDFANKLKV